MITKEGKPVEIAVDYDIAAKEMLKDRNPDEVNAKAIMSSPLITVGSDASVEEASGLLARMAYKGYLCFRMVSS